MWHEIQWSTKRRIGSEILDNLWFREVSPQTWKDQRQALHRVASFEEICELSNEWRDEQLKQIQNRQGDLASRDLSPGDIDVQQALWDASFLLHYGDIAGSRQMLEGLLSIYEQARRDAPYDLRFRYGVTLLREAETRNCIGHHSPDSCIYPLQGRAIHVEQGPAEGALATFEELLEERPSNPELLWLREIAAMTLGGEPIREDYVVGLGQRPDDDSFPRLADRAAELGIFESMTAGGTIMEDLDQDGDLDLLVAGYWYCDPLRYFRNDGPEGFVEATDEAGLNGQRGVFRMSQADYDNDGDLDVFACRSGWIGLGRNSLLENDGTGGFNDVTAERGLDSPVEATMAASWGDYDNAGLVDLCQQQCRRPLSAFSPLSEHGRDLCRCHLQGRVAATGHGHQRTWGDYDNDLDLYVSVFLGPNHLFRNKCGRFQDVTARAGVSRPLMGFPAWFWDYDNDGNLDLIAHSWWLLFEDEVQSLRGEGQPDPAATLKLYRGSGDGSFEDVTAQAGLDKAISTMGGNFGDLDSDGFLDMMLGTGTPSLSHLVPNRLFRNRGGKTFRDESFHAPVGHLQKGHGIAFGDYDEDGDLDLFAQMGGAIPVDRFTPSLFENPGNGNNWLEVALVGTKSNRAGIGARIEAQRTDGRSIFRTVGGGGTFGNSSLRQWIGLGQSAVASVEVTWPSGTVSLVERPAINQRIVIVEPAEETHLSQAKAPSGIRP